MKRIKSILVAAGILLGVSSMQAGERGLIEVNNHMNSGHSIISVVNKGLNYNSLNVFCSTSGESFIKETITDQPSFQKLVNLQELNDGKYTVELKGDNDSVLKEFNVQYGRLMSDQAEDIFGETKNMKFFLDDKRNNLVVSYINPNQNDLLFKLVNTDRDKEVEFLKAGNKLGYSNTYDLNYLRKGNYRATLVSGDKSYHYDFTL